MAENSLSSLSPEALVALALQMKEAIGTGPSNPYGYTSAQVAALDSLEAAAQAANLDVESSKADYRRSVQDRRDASKALLDGVAYLARLAYVNDAVTPGMIAALGLQPRATSRTKVVPKTPVELTASLRPDGDVALRWGRNGNRYGMVFFIKSQVDGGAWGFVRETMTERTVLSGYAPGVQANFRVSAVRNGVASNPSPIATIYPAEAVPALRLAA